MDGPLKTVLWISRHPASASMCHDLEVSGYGRPIQLAEQIRHARDVKWMIGAYHPDLIMAIQTRKRIRLMLRSTSIPIIRPDFDQHGEFQKWSRYRLTRTGLFFEHIPKGALSEYLSYRT